ncbi:MAG: SAM-dependent methyltransferase, partial [Verrucomicrobiota bacterium]|nr:SAM-dependent methyltransferase [Verrucomicrobiota bacterium]
HVISYLPTNEDLLAVFRNARAHLEPGALFAFDFWYGPAVLRDPPAARLKEARLDGAHILRRAAPEIDSAKNIVDVHYHFEVTPPGGAPPFSFSETHRMRYLFGTELELLCAIAGFEPVLLSEWLADPPAPPSSWNGYFMARAR